MFYLERDNAEFEAPNCDGFLLEKPMILLEKYMTIWWHGSAIPINNFLELGIYDGGSIAIWFELLQTDKYVALDLAAWGNTEYFNKFIVSHKLEKRIKIFCKMD